MRFSAVHPLAKPIGFLHGGARGPCSISNRSQKLERVEERIEQNFRTVSANLSSMAVVEPEQPSGRKLEGCSCSIRCGSLRGHSMCFTGRPGRLLLYVACADGCVLEAGASGCGLLHKFFDLARQAAAGRWSRSPSSSRCGCHCVQARGSDGIGRERWPACTAAVPGDSRMCPDGGLPAPRVATDGHEHVPSAHGGRFRYRNR